MHAIRYDLCDALSLRFISDSARNKLKAKHYIALFLQRDNYSALLVTWAHLSRWDWELEYGARVHLTRPVTASKRPMKLTQGLQIRQGREKRREKNISVFLRGKEAVQSRVYLTRDALRPMCDAVVRRREISLITEQQNNQAPLNKGLARKEDSKEKRPTQKDMRTGRRKSSGKWENIVRLLGRARQRTEICWPIRGWRF